jgi:LytS/YehU family sensor histidine kinase
MRARFGDDVAFVVSAPEATLRARVPSLLLQPLVENAVRHGSAARVGRGRIDVRARRDGDRLVLEVENDGGAGGPDDGEPASDGGSGVGLAGTAERLALLYGTGQTLATGLGERGGFLVSIRIPFHADPAPPARRDLPELSVPSHARAPR